MNLNSNYSEMLSALNAAGARYLIVGAHAVAFHARPRATADFDIWVDAAPDNAARVYQALAQFGAPLEQLTPEDLTGEDFMFQIGVAPLRIDIITDIDGVTFAEAWPHRFESSVDGVKINVIGRDALLKNKKAAGRSKDLADVELLERERQRG